MRQNTNLLLLRPVGQGDWDEEERGRKRDGESKREWPRDTEESSSVGSARDSN